MNKDRRNDASGVGSLAKNTLFLYLMSLSSQVINLVLIPFQTRVLGSEAYGVISLAVSMSSIVTIVLDFGFILSATERVVGLVGDRPGLSRLLSNVAHAKAMLALALGVIVTALIVLVPPFCNNRILFVLYYLAYVANAFLPDFFYRGHEDMRIITMRTVAIKVVSALPVFVLLRGSADMWVVPALLLLGNVGAVVFSYRDVARRYGIVPSGGSLREQLALLRSSFGFFVSRFASVFYQSLNAVLLGFVYPGQSVVGFYGAAEKFLAYTKTVSSPVADSLYPYMVRTKNYRLCIRLLIVACPIILVVAIVAWVFAVPLCLFVFGPGYEGAATLLRCLMPAIVVIFPTYILCFPMLVPMGLADFANRSNVIGAVVQVALVGALFLMGTFSAPSLCLAASASEVSVFLFRLWAVVSNRRLMQNPEAKAIQ